MARLTFLVAEPPPYEGLSTRKLVLETAYYNVLTAYSAQEIGDVLQRFPNVDAVVFHTGLPNVDCESITRYFGIPLKRVPIIAVTSTDNEHVGGATKVISSHDPQLLLATIRSIFGESPTFTK